MKLLWLRLCRAGSICGFLRPGYGLRKGDRPRHNPVVTLGLIRGLEIKPKLAWGTEGDVRPALPATRVTQIGDVLILEKKKITDPRYAQLVAFLYWVNREWNVGEDEDKVEETVRQYLKSN